MEVEVFSSAQTGQVQREVFCEKCGCNYSYEMVRRGRGEAMTPSGFGEAAAEQRAQAAAAASLNNLLQSQHDPVACPDCGWVQSYMVEAMRVRAHRWLSRGSYVVGFLLGACAFFGFFAVAGIGGRSFQEDDLVRIFALVLLAPLTVIAGTAGRSFWSKSINPNRHYPQRPSPIPGAPIGVKRGCGPASTVTSAATTAGDASNTLSFNTVREPLVNAIAAIPEQPSVPSIESGGWVTLQIANAHYPGFCCSCLKATDGVSSFKCAQLASLMIPICPSCEKHRSANQTLFIIGGVMWGGCLTFLLTFFAPKSDLEASLKFAGFGAVIGFFVGAWLARKSGPVKFSSFSQELNTVRVRFSNPNYLRLLVDHGKLV